MYVNKEQHLIMFGAGAELDLASTGVAGHSWYCISGCQASRLVAVVSTVLSSSAPAQITYRLRPIPGSASGQSSIGVLGVGSSSGVGSVGQAFYKDINPVAVHAGSQVVTDVTVAATSSGKCVPGFEVIDGPQNALAESKMVLSVV